jgi:integrase
MARFSLETGLRHSNVTGLQWSQIDLVRRTAWVHADQTKARKAIAVPLSATAVTVVREQIGRHSTHVFSYRGNAVRQVNTKAWRTALGRVGISDFRWHDLRHTRASWHVQAGTPLHVLRELGSWECVEMVRKYAHLARETSRAVRPPYVRLAVGPAGGGSGYGTATRRQMKGADRSQPLDFVARPAGFEPTTPWFVARYSIQLSYGR